jgi:hypothetical protein
MAVKVVHPQLGAKSFSCPHCGALANQTWYKVYVDAYDKDNHPSAPDEAGIWQIQTNPNLPPDIKEKWAAYFKKLLAKELFIERHSEPTYLILSIPALSLSECFSCSAMALWLTDKLMHPSQHSDIIPNEDMPGDVRMDFLEAASIGAVIK